MPTPVVCVRFPTELKEELKREACRQSLERDREVSWVKRRRSTYRGGPIAVLPSNRTVTDSGPKKMGLSRVWGGRRRLRLR